MRRRTRARVIHIAPAPNWDPEVEVLHAYDSRKKLQAAIAAEKQKREAAELEETKLFATEIAGSQVVSVDAIVHRYQYGKTAAEHAKQQGDVLDGILALLERRYDQLKTESTDVVNAALMRRIEALEKNLAGQKEGDKGLEEEIKVLKAEVSKLPKVTPKKTT